MIQVEKGKGVGSDANNFVAVEKLVLNVIFFSTAVRVLVLYIRYYGAFRS